MFLPQLIVIAVLVYGVGFLLYAQFESYAFLVGAAIFFVYAAVVRLVVPKSQRRGMKLVRQGEFRPAIEQFEQSYDFFSRHEWIDRYRSITLLTPSAVSYREIALLNIAYCYSQLGEGQQAKVYYERALAEFPESGMAESALNLINSVSKE